MSPRCAELATNSSLNAEQARAFIETTGLNASLPAALFGEGAELLYANERMLQLLGPQLGKKYPVPVERVQTAWPFFNEDKAGPALFKALLLTRATPSKSLTAELGLKTFRLTQKPVPGHPYRVVVAELLRAGDLLADRESRQTLFRSMAHEIRTAVSTLKGFSEMLEVKDESNEKILSRMKYSLDRLEKVVTRLSDFRAELDENGADD